MRRGRERKEKHRRKERRRKEQDLIITDWCEEPNLIIFFLIIWGILIEWKGLCGEIIIEEKEEEEEASLSLSLSPSVCVCERAGVEKKRKKRKCVIVGWLWSSSSGLRRSWSREPECECVRQHGGKPGQGGVLPPHQEAIRQLEGRRRTNRGVWGACDGFVFVFKIKEQKKKVLLLLLLQPGFLALLSGWAALIPGLRAHPTPWLLQASPRGSVSAVFLRLLELFVFVFLL